MTIDEKIETIERETPETEEDSFSDRFWDSVNEFPYRRTAMKAADLYFHTKGFERSGKLYRRLGVRGFQKAWRFIVEGVVGKVDPEAVKEGYLPKYNQSCLEDYFAFSKTVEAFHVAAGAFLIPATIDQFSRGKYAQGCALAALNVLGIFYPIVLQRFNRARLENYLENSGGENDNK